MAEGGAEFGREDPDLDYQLDHDDDDEQEVNRTQPFQPDAASTPYHGGEQVEMLTMQHEQSGLLSYEETPPLLERTPSISDLQKESFLRQKLKKSVDTIKEKFSKAKFKKIPIRRGTGKNKGDIVAVGPKGGECKILKDDESGLMKGFLDAFKGQLGPRTEETIAKERDTMRETRKTLREEETQLKQAEKLSSQRDKIKKEIDFLGHRLEEVRSKIDEIYGEYGSNVESEAELRRLKQLEKNLQTDLKNAEKKWPRL